MKGSPYPPEAAATISTSTLIRLEGGDALQVLHRISTQSLTDLEPGRCRATLFCDFRGRLLHRACVARARDGSVWLLRDDGRPESLLAYVDRHVFREDLRLADATPGHLVRPSYKSSSLPAGSIEERDGVPRAIQIDESFGLVVESRAKRSAKARSEVARIRAGQPRHGHEIHEAFNPFEVGLAHEVHLNKGCFTGQEALMRLQTYGSVRRQLARVSAPGTPPESPRDLQLDGNKVGRLTSVASHAGGWIGLAVLKNELAERGAASALDDLGTVEISWFAPTRPLGVT